PTASRPRVLGSATPAREEAQPCQTRRAVSAPNRTALGQSTPRGRHNSARHILGSDSMLLQNLSANRIQPLPRFFNFNVHLLAGLQGTERDRLAALGTGGGIGKVQLQALPVLSLLVYSGFLGVVLVIDRKSV